MTYVSRHTRLLIPRWLEPGDEGWIYALRRKRSDHKLKFLNSCEDLRAWVDDECLRTQHFIESMSYNEFLGDPSCGVFGRFIPISYLLDVVNKDAFKEGEACLEKGGFTGTSQGKQSVDKSIAEEESTLGDDDDEDVVELLAKASVHPSVLKIAGIKSDTAAADGGKFKGSSPGNGELYADDESGSSKEGQEGSAGKDDSSNKEEVASCNKETSSCKEDYQTSLDLLCRYCDLLCRTVNKLEEVEYSLSAHNRCTCEESKFSQDMSFEEFFSNCEKYMVEDSQTVVESCCHCDSNCVENSMPPTPEPSLGPSISCDQLGVLKPEKQDHIEDELIRRISNFKQRLNQIEEHWKDLNEEIKISQRKIEEYRESCNCQETEKLKELREKLQELVFERGCISRQKCEALRDLTNLKSSACARFTKSDVSVTKERDINFGKFPSCQCGFEECSTSIDASSAKSGMSFSPVTRSSNGKSFQSMDRSSYRFVKLGSNASPRRSKSEPEIQGYIKALQYFENRVCNFENLNKDIDTLKQKAMRADYLQGELQRACECREEYQRESEEEKKKLCLQIEGLNCVINHLKVKLDEKGQEVRDWQCKDEEITELEKEAEKLKRKLCKSHGDYKEAKRYSTMLEQLVTLQRNQIERLMLQIHKMSKFIKADKQAEMSGKNIVRSKSYSPDVNKPVRSTSTKIIKTTTTITIPDENPEEECCCLADEPSDYPHPRGSTKIEGRGSMKHERKRKKYRMPAC